MQIVNSTALIAAALLVACAAPPQQTSPSGQAYQGPANTSDEVDLVPPPPTFQTTVDCELAYGQGACGTGADVYAAAKLPPPENAAGWYAPMAYRNMTGVLENRYYAAPGVYVASMPYGTFVSPVVVQRYRVVDRSVIEVYRRAPLSIRNEVNVAGLEPVPPRLVDAEL